VEKLEFKLMQFYYEFSCIEKRIGKTFRFWLIGIFSIVDFLLYVGGEVVEFGVNPPISNRKSSPQIKANE
jgi:hypothetical protein